MLSLNPRTELLLKKYFLNWTVNAFQSSPVPPSSPPLARLHWCMWRKRSRLAWPTAASARLGSAVHIDCNGYNINYIIDKLSFPSYLFILRHFPLSLSLYLFFLFLFRSLCGCSILLLLLLLPVYTFPGCAAATATMASNVLQQIRSLIYAKTCFDPPPFPVPIPCSDRDRQTARRADKQIAIWPDYMANICQLCWATRLTGHAYNFTRRPLDGSCYWPSWEVCNNFFFTLALNLPINCWPRFRCAVCRCADIADCQCQCMCVWTVLRFIYLFNAMFCLDSAHCLPDWLTSYWTVWGWFESTSDIYPAIILFLWCSHFLFAWRRRFLDRFYALFVWTAGANGKWQRATANGSWHSTGNVLLHKQASN